MIFLLKLFRRRLCFETKDLVNVLTRKPTRKGYDTSQFVDYKILKVCGGNGGDGLISLLKVFCNPLAGPDGGNGGNGGHIIFKACCKTIDLKNIDSLISGKNGAKGMGKGMDGMNGNHTVISVPVGTLVKSFETKEVLVDLVEDGNMFVAARGGEGGKGNKFFLSQEHRAPTLAERGGQGEKKGYVLEVKLLADIGLVGLPNAGKSTLLRALTRASPKVAPYAFTTIKPHIGKIEFTNPTWNPITICDIPGIIKDSHKNRGLGLEFLRHIERCNILAFIIDLSNDPVEQFWVLTNELNLFRPMLLSLPRIIVCNKMDLPETRKSFEHFRLHLNKLNDTSTLVVISAMNSINLDKVVCQMKILRDKHVSKLNQ